MTDTVDSSRRRWLRWCGGVGLASVSGCLRLTQDGTEGTPDGTDGGGTGPATDDGSGGTPDFDVELTPAWNTDRLFNIASADGDFFAGFSELTRLRPDGDTVFTSEFPDKYDADIATGWRNSLHADSSGVYVGAGPDDESQGGRVYAFDPETGTQRWMVEEPADGRHNNIRATTRIDDLVVYASQSDGSGDEQEPIVRAVDTDTGETQWQIDLPEGFVTSIHGYEGRLYIKQTFELYVYDISTQEHIDEIGRGGGFNRAVRQDDTLYVGGDPMRALALPSGEERWAVETDFEINTAPALGDDALFVGSEAGYVSAHDRASGEQLWEYRLDGVVSHPPVVADGLVWVASERGGLSALTAQGGNLAYQTEVGPDFSFAIQDDILIDSERERAFEISR